MSGFLLVVVAATFAGDSVAGDAAWGNLRYLLMRPVPRGRLLVAKAAVAGVLIWASTILVSIAALVGGVILFGAHPVTVPTVSPSRLRRHPHSARECWWRASRSPPDTSRSATPRCSRSARSSRRSPTRRPAPSARPSASTSSPRFSRGISQLGEIRYGFPTYYIDKWQSMFTQDSFSHDMIAGIVVQIVYLFVFGTIAVVWFRRKDIRS